VDFIVLLCSFLVGFGVSARDPERLEPGHLLELVYLRFACTSQDRGEGVRR
jgi:hypothetical protein